MTTEPRSEAERIAQIDPEERVKWLAKVKPEDQWQLEYDWNLWARDDQRPPEGDWRTWFVMAGRGFGKTRMAAEWVRAQAEADGVAAHRIGRSDNARGAQRDDRGRKRLAGDCSR